MTLKILKQEKNMQTSEHNNSEIKRFSALNERKKMTQKTLLLSLVSEFSDLH